MERLIKALAAVNETTLSRVWKHFDNPNIPAALISAFIPWEKKKPKPDHAPSPQEAKEHEQDNLKRNHLLAGKVRMAGYGYTFVDGMYTYAGKTEPEPEQTIFVVGNENDNGKLHALIVKWVMEFNQESMLFKPEGLRGQGLLIWNHGGEEVIGHLSPDKIGAIYTRLRGRGARAFVFEHAYYPKSYTWIERLYRESLIRKGKMTEEETALYRLA